MNPTMPRYIKMDDWIFEIKTVRALKSPVYGDPYTAISNLNFMCDTVYIDGQMTREEDQFTRKDFDTFYAFCQQLGIKNGTFDRVKNGQRNTKAFDIEPLEKSEPIFRLVR